MAQPIAIIPQKKLLILIGFRPKSRHRIVGAGAPVLNTANAECSFVGAGFICLCAEAATARGPDGHPSRVVAKEAIGMELSNSPNVQPPQAVLTLVQPLGRSQAASCADHRGEDHLSAFSGQNRWGGPHLCDVRASGTENHCRCTNAKSTVGACTPYQ
jgi:hypothetical protein